ncbi:MAG TPA: hypothetical protein VK711_05070 [Puia sp.]|jgi:hypothetical protein|nr:hypothetical protein [Puia sp.]
MFSRNAWLFYILALSLTTFYLSRFPGHNGDMPFYIALVIEKEQGSMEGVVERTKEVLRQELPSKEYQDHADRISSVDQMIFERYRIKPFYVLLVLTFHKLGFSYIHATLVPSLLCYFLIGLSIWQVVIKRLDPVKTFLVSMVCMLIFPTLLLARLSTPDSLSCFILLNAVFLIYFGRSKILWYSLFMLAICTRLDNVVSELIFLFALWKWPVDGFANKLDTKKYILMSLGLIGIALLVNLTATHHFLWFMDPDFSEPPGQYLRNIGLYFYVIPGSFFMYLFVIFIISGLSRGFNWKKEANYIFYTVCAVVLLRFLLYPFYEERYLTPYLLFSLLTISFAYADMEKRPKTGVLQGV